MLDAIMPLHPVVQFPLVIHFYTLFSKKLQRYGDSQRGRAGIAVQLLGFAFVRPPLR